MNPHSCDIPGCATCGNRPGEPYCVCDDDGIRGGVLDACAMHGPSRAERLAALEELERSCRAYFTALDRDAATPAEMMRDESEAWEALGKQREALARLDAQRGD